MPHQLLLADDSVTIQRVIKLTFADEDIEVVAVGDGDQAVEAMDKQPPDIVLADVAMPGRTGYDVAQHVRTSPRLAHIPVLLLTGAFEPIDEGRAAEIGCDGVLAKPFEPDVVVSRVKELLAKPRPVAPKAAPAMVTAASPARPAAPVKATPASVAPVASRQAASDVDAYFDRLDQAFATLAQPQVPAAPARESVAVAVAPPVARAAVASPFSPAPSTAAAPPVALDDIFAALAATTTPSAPARTAPMTPTVSPVLPASTPAPQAVGLTDAQLEQIANRVLERLTARLGNPAEIVATIAERVVREEIAQIKSRL